MLQQLCISGPSSVVPIVGDPRQVRRSEVPLGPLGGLAQPGTLTVGPVSAVRRDAGDGTLGDGVGPAWDERLLQQ